MFFVYILESSVNKKYYVGCTDNLERRIKEHNSGLSKYTKTGIPWVFKYKEEYMTLKEARQREKQIKGWKKRIAIERLINAAFV